VISFESFFQMPRAVRVEKVESAILTVRGLRVMLDSDLAKFYGVQTKRLLEQVRRNKHRFPKDFAFQVDGQEVTALRSQIATSNVGRGGRRTLPWVFTEHGVVMLASVLNSRTAIEASIAIVRVFVQLQKATQISGGDLVAKLAQIDFRLGGHDDAIEQVLQALGTLLNPPASPLKETGFHTLMEDIEGCADLINAPRREVRYPAKRRTRKENN
jgi:hypothetical protein